MRARGWPVDLLTTLVVTTIVLGPLLVERGYVLRGDMLLVPDQPWRDAWLGLDGRVPRFVPGDAVLATLGSVLPGDLVQRLVLVGGFVSGGLGIGRLVGHQPALARQAAVVLLLWNPWVHERLGIGQWPFVLGLFVLPWVVLAAEGLSWAPLVAVLGISAILSPVSGLTAVAVALVVRLVRRRSPIGVLVAGLAVNLPWLLPSVLRTGALDAPTGQFTAFGVRAESPLGVVASVLSLGGIWKTSVVPGERAVAVVLAMSLVLTAIAVAGLYADRRSPRTLGVAVAGGLSLLVVLVIAALGGRLDGAASDVPALGLLRDSHRLLAPFVLALACGAAGAAAGFMARASVVLVVAPVLLLPSLAWGLGGDWTPVRYPDEWYAVRRLVPHDAHTVVLPWRGNYRGFAWNDHRATIDPASRFLPGDVLVDDRLYVDGRVLASEDPVLDRIGRALSGADPVAALRRAGVDHVLVEKGQGVATPDLAGARSAYDGTGLALLDLGRPGHSPGGALPVDRRRVVEAVDALVLVGWLAAVAAALVRRSRPVRVSKSGIVR